MLDSRTCKKWEEGKGYEGYKKFPCAACNSWTGKACGDIEDAIEKNKPKEKENPLKDSLSDVV